MLTGSLSKTCVTLIGFLSIFVLCANAQQDEGSACTIKRIGGVCRTLTKCPVIYNELLAGNRPDPKTFCGFVKSEPVICCPNNVDQYLNLNKKTSTGTTSTTMRTTTTVRSKPTRPREMARAKCNEYISNLYELVLPPTLSADKKPVNTTSCSPKNRKLIVGGQKAGPREFPHMTAIGYNAEGRIVWGCGGTLISPNFVLTAAHCVRSPDWSFAVWARVGDLNLVRDDEDARPQTRRIIERIRHPEYRQLSEYHDIALLKLEKPVEFNAWVRPACLPVDLPETDDYKAVATGWGLIDWTNEETPVDLFKVTISLVAQPSCNESYSDVINDGRLQLGIVNEWQICAGELGKDTCQGDSGGPLAVFNKINSCLFNVIGITSVGKICGTSIPGVYTRVYHYVPWIERIVWADEF